MEEGEGEGMEKVVISADSSNSRKNIPNAPPLEGAVQTAGP